MTKQTHYIHAMGHRGLTPLYDIFVRAFLRERALRRRLIDQLSLHAARRVLDVGSGTGTFAVMAKQEHPAVEVTGVDGDPDIIDRARRKAVAARVHVNFQAALATDLPFQDRCFDRVTSTFLMHHLSIGAKEQALREAFRVLEPGGQIHVVDFGPPRALASRALSRMVRSMGEMADNLDGRLPGLLSKAGFANVFEESRMMTAFGVVSYLSGDRPA